MTRSDGGPPPASGPDLVPFKTASSPIEAELIANLLRDSGIPAYVEGSLLADEFAVSQRLLGLNSVRIQVPRDLLAAARETLAQAAAARDAVDAAAEATLSGEPEAPSAPAKPARGPKWSTVLALGAAAVAFFVLWMETRAEVRALTENAVLWLDRDGASAGETVHRWKDNDAVATRQLDRDGNGVPETMWYHDRAGVLIYSVHDDDQNWIGERMQRYAPDGTITAVGIDADQNGVHERIEEYRGPTTVHFLDADQDGRIERIEERGPDRALVRALAWSDDAGFRAAR